MEIKYKVFKVKFRKTNKDNNSFFECGCWLDEYESQDFDEVTKWVEENEKFDGQYFIIKGYSRPMKNNLHI